MCFLFHVSIAAASRLATCTCFAERALEEEKPGGSGMFDALFGFVGSPLFKSMTHLGGGGGVVLLAIVKVLMESMLALEDKSRYRDMEEKT